MTPVFQTVICPTKGNCMQAAVASLFDLDITQVPNFMLYPVDSHERHWWDIYCGFIRLLGYEVKGIGRPCSHKLSDSEGVNGYFDASVPSKTLEGCSHAVIIDRTGLVVHDPNPNQKWLGINVVETGELNNWYVIEKIKESV